MSRLPDRGAGGIAAAAQNLLALFSRRQSIRRTLTIVLTVALVPLAILSTVQGYLRFQREAETSQAELSAVVQRLAQPDRNPVARADSLLLLLARIPTVRSATSEPCAWLMESLTPSLPDDLLLLRAGRNGIVDCASDPAWLGRTMPADGLSGDMGAKDGTSPAQIPAPILVRSQSTADGTAAVAVRLDRLQTPARSGPSGQPDSWAITDGTGRIIFTRGEGQWSSFDLSQPDDRPAQIVDNNGTAWTMAHVRLSGEPGTPGAIHFVRLRAGTEPLSSEWWFSLTFLALPLLALLLASSAVWVGTNHSILRWISELRDVTGSIAEGQYRLPSERFEDAPTEIRTLASDVQRMARTIAERDRTLNEALDRQKALVLELNHRVRNNLQLIGSYLTLEAARVGTPENARPIEQVRLRVSALALVHRLVYSHHEQPSVNARTLLDALADLLNDSFPLAAIAVQADDVAVGVDSAIPIVLWVIEAMDWRVRQPETSARLALTVEEGATRITLALDRQSGEPSPAPRLLVALARQIGGTADLPPIEGERVEMRLHLPSANLFREFHANIGNNR